MRPITALQAVLENIVDGVAEPDPETFATMLAQVERLTLKPCDQIALGESILGLVVELDGHDRAPLRR